MNQYPKISIVTPVYNQEKYLEATINSVLNQHYPNLEYIIIDGGSTDGTVDIIRKYAEKLSYWVSEPDKGMYDAIRKGFEQSTGEIMGWLNADDVYLMNSLFAVAAVFKKNTSVQWITSHHTVINEDDVIVYEKPSLGYSKHFFYLEGGVWRGNEIGQESTFWRRSLWDAAGACMSNTLRLAGDFELWLRFFEHAQLIVVNTAFAAFRSRSGQLSSDADRYYKEATLALKEHPLNKVDQKILNTYKRKLGFSRRINRLRFLDGDKLCRMGRFRRCVLCIPESIDVDLSD